MSKNILKRFVDIDTWFQFFMFLLVVHLKNMNKLKLEREKVDAKQGGGGAYP